MTSAKKIRELVDALVAAGGTATETLDRLDVLGRLDQAQLEGWAVAAAAVPIVGIDSISAIDALGDAVDLATDAVGFADEELRIQVSKTRSVTAVFCLTDDGVTAVFADFVASAVVRQVWVACDFESFKAESCRVDSWTSDASDVPLADDDVQVPDPRRLVKDFVGSRVPRSVFPHLLASSAPAPSTVFERWKNLAVVRLLHSLVNEVIATGTEQVVITGARPRKIDCNLKAPFSQELFVAVTDAARWVYASGRDVDTRFALFTYELSREWPDALTFGEGFAARGELALEAAKTAYRAYVQETSKDTLKSLGDLRKTLSEEVTKVVSQTRDLLGTMWRDFMVAATAFLGRVVLLGTDKPLINPGPLKALLSGAAVFLVFSLILALRTNAKFMAIADVSRADWRRKLYGFVNDEDFKKLSDAPLLDSTREYKRVVRWVVFAYVVVISCLLWSAWGSDVSQIAGKPAQGEAPSSSASNAKLQPAVAAKPAASAMSTTPAVSAGAAAAPKVTKSP
jgi:hypothetical protein